MVLKNYQDDIIVSGRVWLDETYYGVMMRDAVVNPDGSLLRGLSKNKMRVGVATGKENTAIIAQGHGKPTQSMTYDTFGAHIKPGSALVHNKETTHKRLAKNLRLTSEAYSSKDLRGPEDFENPLDPANHIHYLTKRFLHAHSGFDRQEIQSYLNLYAFILNLPSDKLEKIEKLLNIVIQASLTDCAAERFY